MAAEAECRPDPGGSGLLRNRPTRGAGKAGGPLTRGQIQFSRADRNRTRPKGSASPPPEFTVQAEQCDIAKRDIETISFSFVTWCMSLTRWVLAAKTAFSKYLSSTLHICRDGPQSSPTALFPLPLPSFAPYAAEEPGQPKKSRREKAIDRALHVLVSALNYTYMANSFPPLDLIRRQPNLHQRRALRELRLLLSANDRGAEVQVSTSGRKNLGLLSRLQELAQAVDALGISSGPYSDDHGGHAVPADNSGHPQLSPFSSLKADRLKISGQGQWKAADYMPPQFQMSFLEPQILELDQPVYTRGKPNIELETPAEVYRLLRRWDDLGLLALHPVSQVHPGPEGKVKVFNAYKSAQWDRQIGDRRLRNACEGRIPGPSQDLPCGPLITRLFVPAGCGVRVCITDRSDYYHQMQSTYERSRTNLLWPPFKLEDFVGFSAYKDYLARAEARKKPVDRNVHGDELNGLRPADFGVAGSTMVFGGFQSVLQGDHLGVEYGIAAHAGFLEENDLLKWEDRLQMSSLIRPRGLYEGLVIDDYFTISPVPEEELSPQGYKPSRAFAAFTKAKRAYADAGLAGSDAKDVVDEALATVVGAELDSRPEMVREGLLPVGAPSAKRMSLSWICLNAAHFAYTTDALHSSLVGALVSVFCFRRSSMALINQLFKVIQPAELDVERPKLRSLSRAAANELVLCGVFLPVLVSNIKAEVSQTIFCTDASTSKGAKRVAEALWQSGDFKGGHVLLESIPKTILKSHGGFEEEDWEEMLEEFGDPFETGADLPPPVERPLAQVFDFIEVCGGSGVVSEQMAMLGYTVGPIIDLSYSPHYDMTKTRTLEWLLYLVQSARVRALMLEPPCTTFSAAAHPMVRSYKCPRGFNQKSTKVWVGNRLAFFCLCLLWCALHAQVFALLETPRRSEMAWLTEWAYLLSLEGVVETFTASCSFGSPFQKEFRFLTANMQPHEICHPCTRDHEHVRIEGVLTKGSAVYCPALAASLAKLFHKHLRAESKALNRVDIKTAGLEGLLTNELAKKACWEVSSSWKWKGNSHINILELASLFQAMKKAARRGGGRFCFLLDSYVALRASSKGRSSSRALAPLLRKIFALSQAFAVYAAGLFCPTRLNPSDDPTRDVPLRTPQSDSCFMDFLDFNGLYSMAAMPKLRRWASNWASLTLGILLAHGFLHSSFLQPQSRLRSSKLPMSLHEVLQDFDSTLGFPGEGPCGGLARFLFCWQLLAVLLALSHGMRPRHTADESRALARVEKPLEFGRPVQQSTKTNRDRLLQCFSDWLRERGVLLQQLLNLAPKEPEQLIHLLTRYGIDLYTSGRPYSHYAETINSIGAQQPGVRRLLSGAWDLAFSWLREEPYEHHVACPYQVMLAATTLAIVWGWPRVAGAILLSWGAICRIGEVVAAKRSDLVLPVDTGGALWTVMLRVGEPKTRFRAARHQLARLDWQDLVGVIVSIYEDLHPSARLWPWSPQALRTRFKQLLEALGLPTVQGPLGRPLDLGSLRAGGATHLLMVTEDSELVRRRGRWISARTMEIYLQEASSSTFFPQLPVRVKDRIHDLARAFPEVSLKLQVLMGSRLPPATWFYFFSKGTDPKDGKAMGAGAAAVCRASKSRQQRSNVE